MLQSLAILKERCMKTVNVPAVPCEVLNPLRTRGALED